MAELTRKQRGFLGNPLVGTVTTLRRDGAPHSTVVWVDTERDEVLFNTAVGRAKERHLRDDSRVAVMVVGPENTYKWGRSLGAGRELSTEGADGHIDKLAKKHLGQDEYPSWRNSEEGRIIVRLRPEQIEATGLDE